MKVGIVCPYALDVPGGVQQHVLELAEALLGLGVRVSVLAPAEADVDADLPPNVVPVRGAVALPYNGSVARLAFGPSAVARVRRWLADERPDVVHVHEPAVPSLGLLASWAAEVPVVATFHASMATTSRALAVAGPVLRPALEQISARIAVSRPALATMQRHVGGSAVIIPNGLWVAAFADAAPDPRWASGDTVVFLGRMEEPRKGLDVLVAAWPEVVRSRPEARLLVAGHGDVARVRSRVVSRLPTGAAGSVHVLGALRPPEKAGLLAAADVFVAPHTGGESFGLVLVEAMAAGAAVLASDLPAFVDVLEGGGAGDLFATGDPAALAAGVLGLLQDPDRRTATAHRAARGVQAYDWSVVARRVLRVYETAAGSGRAAARDRRRPGSGPAVGPDPLRAGGLVRP